MCCREVESVGVEVSEVKQGDFVIPTFMAECEKCRDCTSSKSNLCSKQPFKLSQGMPQCGTSRFTDIKGEVLHHFMFVSSFSEYTVVDVTHLTKLDPVLISPDKACLLGCGVSTGSSNMLFLHGVYFNIITQFLNIQIFKLNKMMRALILGIG